MAKSPSEKIAELSERVTRVATDLEARSYTARDRIDELVQSVNELREGAQSSTDRLSGLEQKVAAQKETIDRLWNIVLAIVMAVVLGVVAAGINQLLPKTQPTPATTR